ncbi:hypothetical protein CJF42_10310 [Pseudoalteromonas sp. NBT06-2]|uniref:DUF2867 domain-containing protein n=1 Tax=Pseudoalteromonas sp. NBT06-2 TaxID=2025950 RepID=UPI000BA754C0|nr:DUF2867 domain-containing protein [Pseudoalteromonas sp. NBT06-2]PAJ74493.1 hypothetical protein CJF42_10310 [Pseudoalteromonas sp. NBT06-2]
MNWLFPNIHTLKEPQNDILASKVKKPYFRDALSVEIQKTELSPSQLQHAIFAYMPKWVSLLMAIRNRIVKLFGFEVGADNLKPASDELEIGDKAGFLTITEKLEGEIISYAEDKHMVFYISVLKQSNEVIVSTLVNQKTLIGRIYPSYLEMHDFSGSLNGQIQDIYCR